MRSTENNLRKYTTYTILLPGAACCSSVAEESKYESHKHSTTAPCIDPTLSTAEEKKEVLQWAVRAFYHKVEVTENESQRLLKDFLEVFCESVEGMMNLCPHADGICVMGP